MKKYQPQNQLKRFVFMSSWKDKITSDNGIRAVFDRDSLILKVSNGHQQVQSECMDYNIKDQRITNGATPRGLYLIQKERLNEKRNMPWFNLRKLKEDGTDFYPYIIDQSKYGKHRDAFAIHQAVNVTHGCVSAWQFEKIRKILNKGDVTYNGQSFCGFLKVQ